MTPEQIKAVGEAVGVVVVLVGAFGVAGLLVYFGFRGHG